jgi:glutathionylspermidine synthase
MEMSSTNLLWFLAFVFLAGGNGFGGLFGGRAPMGPPPASQMDLTMGLNNQSIMNELNALGLATANNNYETARLISDQNLLMATQNNTNQINVIQGFNQIAGKIDALSAQIASCCCEIKTQMLQDRLADAQAKIVAQQAEISNNAQTQTLLAQMGKWVANAPAAGA